MEICIRHDVYIHNGGDPVVAKPGSLDAKLDAISGAIKAMSPELQAMTDEVHRSTSVSASAVALIQGLAAKMEAAKDDPAAIQALADSLKKSDDEIAAAVTANTPAGSTPVTGANPI